MIYLDPIVDEIYMPKAILSLAHPSILATGNNDIETSTDSYEFWRERALFDYVADETSTPIREFAFHMSEFVPYDAETGLFLQTFETPTWDLVSKKLLLKRKEIKDAIRGGEIDNFEDVLRCRLTGRDYLLELMIRSIERHAREYRSSPSRVFFEN